MRNLLITIVIISSSLNMAWAAEDQLEPEVTIVQQGENVVEEYRLNGNLYMIKITPSKGMPYYLVDSDGDGMLETRRNSVDPEVIVPRWTIFEW